MPRPGKGAQPYTCSCGKELLADTPGVIAAHEKSARHMAWATAQLDPDPEEQARDYDGPDPEQPDDAGRVVEFPVAGGTSLRDRIARAEAIADIWQTRAIDKLGRAPVTAEFWDRNREANSKAWKVLCESHPKLLAATERSIELMAFEQLGTFGAGLAVAVMAEMRLVNADGFLAEMTGVAAAYEHVMAQQAQFAEDASAYYDRYRSSEDYYAPAEGLAAELAAGG